MSGSIEEDLSKFVWDTRYRDPGASPPESNIATTWRRVAQGAAAIENDPAAWGERFLEILRGFCFLSGGRILAGAGTTRQVTLLSCFAMGRIEDSIPGISCESGMPPVRPYYPRVLAVAR